MRLIIILPLIFTIFSSYCFAQTDKQPKLIPYKLNEKRGFINNKGKIVIEPKFDEADKFSEGLARVEIGLKSGFIDFKGKFVIEPVYTFAFSFSEGLAVVGKDMEDDWFYIDHKGKAVIEPNQKFIWLGPFKYGLAQFSMNIGGNTTDTYDARNGFIDRTGKIIIEPKFGHAENFFDGLAMIAEDKKRDDGAPAYFNSRAFIDTKGYIVTPFFDSAENFSEGLAAVEINNRWGFVDKTGNLVIPPKFEFVLSFIEGFAIYGCKNDKFGFIDRKGNEITGCIFENAGNFSDGLAPVSVENKGYGFIDSNGKLVIRPQFRGAESFYYGLARVSFIKDGWIYEGYINHKGEYIIKPVKKEEIKETDEKIELE